MINDLLLPILVDALALLALINPISKISVLCILGKETDRAEMQSVVLRSSLIAAAILFTSMIAGEFVLRRIFNVDIHSLRIAGGAVLFWVGFGALQKGVFFERGTQERFLDLSIVPLACPMIAGPATISAIITLITHRPLPLASASLAIAVGINLILMLLSRPIGAVLVRFNILGALIRITGLVVMTMGVQMVLDGLATWLGEIGR